MSAYTVACPACQADIGAHWQLFEHARCLVDTSVDPVDRAEGKRLYERFWQITARARLAKGGIIVHHGSGTSSKRRKR